MLHRKPVNAPALLVRIAHVGNTHPRRIEIATAFQRDSTRASEVAAELLEALEKEWGLIEWWTDAQLGEWLETAAATMEKQAC